MFWQGGGKKRLQQLLETRLQTLKQTIDLNTLYIGKTDEQLLYMYYHRDQLNQGINGYVYGVGNGNQDKGRSVRVGAGRAEAMGIGGGMGSQVRQSRNEHHQKYDENSQKVQNRDHPKSSKKLIKIISKLESRQPSQKLQNSVSFIKNQIKSSKVYQSINNGSQSHGNKNDNQL